ncbi:hypothetical protein O988_05114 [Pseudogymnoascus sp. VKM F-3808]|nr:hypothetical protein O988_05114 [Pseudogymnoascus sp. VKM F-3808]
MPPLHPQPLYSHERGLIANEGATVTVVEGDYDAAVRSAAEKSTTVPSGLLTQDTSFDGYEAIPSWIVDGYSTMLYEIDSQLEEQGSKPTIIITPVGVGSLAPYLDICTTHVIYAINISKLYYLRTAALFSQTATAGGRG